MKDLLIFILGAIGGKLIEDNLPNLHYKNLYKGFEGYVAPMFLFSYIGYLYIIVKLTKDAEAKKNLDYIITITAADMGITKMMGNNKRVA